MNSTQLKEEAIRYNEMLSVEMSDDINEVIMRGNELMVVINRTGGMFADAKKLLDEAMHREAIQLIQEIAGKTFSAKVQNALVDSIAKEERWLVNYIEQLNKTAKYQIEWCRSVLSKQKEEMKYLNNFHG